MTTIFEHRAFKLKQTIDEIEKYANACFEQNHKNLKEKPFYHYYEWSGWRFYLKALRYRDWKSIWKRIKGKFELSTP
jgi:hypothetical protein